MADGPSKEFIHSIPAEVVLRDIASRHKRLICEATEALYERKDADLYDEKLRSSAQLIADIPKVLGVGLVDSSALSEAAWDEVGYFSDAANSALDSGNKFAMGVLLTPKGSRLGDLNDLERLIERVYPSGPELSE